jgi:hypothetical protein
MRRALSAANLFSQSEAISLVLGAKKRKAVGWENRWSGKPLAGNAKNAKTPKNQGFSGVLGSPGAIWDPLDAN